ncbi:unnamed protein product [Dicrocoelium dendriticum]|nr:unnamed protein product [Dicrocoelium dendriticum]
MMDLCAIFHGLCQPRLKLILSSVFTHQEKYLDDLKCLFDALFEIFNHVESQASLPSGYNQLLPVVAYLSDISWSLYSFLTTLAQLTTRRPIDVCLNSGGIERFAAFFERVFSSLQIQIEAAFQLSSSQRQTLLSDLSRASTLFIWAVREGLLEPCFLNRIRQLCDEGPCFSDRLADDPAIQLAQRYMDQTLQLLSYRKFSLAMQLLYPSEKDVSSIRRLVGKDGLDDATSQYLFAATEALLSEADIHPEPETTTLDERTQPAVSSTRTRSIESEAGLSMSKSVREVREVLPHLDVELIQRYLDELCGDPSKVINAALECTFPENAIHRGELVKIQKNPKPQSEKRLEMDLATAAATGVITLQPDHLWQGKRVVVLPELSKREKRLTLRSAFSIWEDDEDNNRFTSELADGVPKKSERCFENVYEDEYDDSYDIREGIVDEVHSDEQSRSLPFTTNVAACDPSNTGSSLRTDANQRQTVLRIENPESVRQRQEEFKIARQAEHRKHMKPRNPRPLPVMPQPVPSGTNREVPFVAGSLSKVVSDDFLSIYEVPNHDASSANESTVTSDSLFRCIEGSDRHYRGIHKARLGNHNRRWLADRKRRF